jgi:lipopolysaccharide transport protein LptA
MIKRMWLVTFSFVLLSKTIVASPDDSIPLTVQSDSLSVNYATQEGVYVGNVVVDQGSRHLTGDHIHLTRDPTLKQFSEIHAFGSSNAQAYIELVPKLGEAQVRGNSDEIIYHPILHTVIFKGKVELDQAGRVYHGPIATYDLETGMINSPPSKEGRVEMFLPPGETISENH